MCKVFVKRLIACMVAAVVVATSIICFSFSASAASYVEPYIIYSTDLREIFPDRGQHRADFFQESNFELPYYTSYVFEFGSDGWPYIKCDVTSRYTLDGCRSAFFSLLFAEEYIEAFESGQIYKFDFVMKFQNDGNIGNSSFIGSVGVNFSPTDVTLAYFKPVSVWSSGNHTYAYFNFEISGDYFTGVKGWCRFLIFNFNSKWSCNPCVSAWVDPEHPFSVRPLTTEEIQARLTAEEIANIGDDIELPDETDTVNKAQDSMDKLTNVEKDYKVDTAEVNDTLGISEDLFGDSEFTKAFSFIDNTVTRYIDTSYSMYLFYCTILGLGIAFAALGRSL